MLCNIHSGLNSTFLDSLLLHVARLALLTTALRRVHVRIDPFTVSTCLFCLGCWLLGTC